MLTHIYIRNFAIINEIDIDLKDGLNIITGETGTGKSIVIQAINMALGGRGSSSFISDGADKALIQLMFSLSDNEKKKIESYISEVTDNELIISREFNRSGKNMIRMNGEIVNLSVLTEVSSHLIDVHGQYDNQILLNADNHMRIIDNYALNEIAPLKKKLSLTYGNYNRLYKELEQIRTNRSEFLRKRDFMKFEMNEIDVAAPKSGEDEELAERLNLLQNSEKIYSALNECYDILYSSQLSKCSTLLASISEFNQEYAVFEENLNTSMYALDDLCEDIRKARENISFSPDEVDSSINRLDVLDRLKMKYGGSLEKVLEYREACASQLSDYEGADEREEELSEQLNLLKSEILKQSKSLSDIRKKSASELCKKMTDELINLNFPHADFSADFKEKKDADGKPELSANGFDCIEFLFNANKGGRLKPLAEIASGGEISRISLAFKSITNDLDNVYTMIFDEIDTGISGITASVVGRKMHQIAEKHQILCITHLPQIAAAGDFQFQISKDDTDEKTFTTISMLSEKERVMEIARLLGGTNITDTTIASAKELIEAAH